MSGGHPPALYVMAILAALGGLLFGYDTGVVSGGMPLVKKDFQMSGEFWALSLGSIRMLCYTALLVL